MRIISLFIPGAPKSKGSLEHRGGGKMREAVVGSTTWKRKMAGLLESHWNKFYPGQRTEAPVRVTATFFLPVATHEALITERASGNYDLDKLIRNLGDAITEAKIWKDDSQAVCWIAVKMPANSTHPQGVSVVIEEC